LEGDVPRCIAAFYSFQDHFIKPLNAETRFTLTTVNQKNIEVITFEKSFQEHSDFLTALIMNEMLTNASRATHDGLLRILRNPRATRHQQVILVTDGADERNDMQEQLQTAIDMYGNLPIQGSIFVVVISDSTDSSAVDSYRKFQNDHNRNYFKVFQCQCDPRAIWQCFQFLFQTIEQRLLTTDVEKKQEKPVALKISDELEITKALSAQLANASLLNIHKQQEKVVEVPILPSAPVYDPSSSPIKQAIHLFSPQAKKNTPPQPIIQHSRLYAPSAPVFTHSKLSVESSVIKILKNAPDYTMGLSQLGHEFKKNDPQNRSFKDYTGQKLKDFLLKHESTAFQLLDSDLCGYERVRLVPALQTAKVQKEINLDQSLGIIHNSNTMLCDVEKSLIAALDGIEEIIRDIAHNLISGIGIDYQLCISLLQRERENIEKLAVDTESISSLKKSLQDRIDALLRGINLLSSVRGDTGTKLVRKGIADEQKEHQRIYRELKDTFGTAGLCPVCLVHNKNTRLHPCKHEFCEQCVMSKLHQKCAVCAASFLVYHHM
jgi:hypothetical protein